MVLYLLPELQNVVETGTSYFLVVITILIIWNCLSTASRVWNVSRVKKLTVSYRRLLIDFCVFKNCEELNISYSLIKDVANIAPMTRMKEVQAALE
jgi:hypothetical protein